MTSLNGYIQGLGSGADRIVRKTGTTVKLSVFDNIDDVIVFNEAGETTQETLTGKNLAEIIDDGTVPSAVNGSLVPADGCRSDYISVEPNTNYTFSLKTARDSFFFYYDSSKSFIRYDYNNPTVSITRTTPNNASYIMLRLSGELSDNVEPQLEKGSPATAYEPYCGGVPSPNPSYPQDIKGIGTKRQDGTYSVSISYDDGDEHFGSITASGLAYPLYEGDILDFVNGKVIRANGYKVLDGSENWFLYPDHNGYYLQITDMKSGNQLNGKSDRFIKNPVLLDVENTFQLGFNNAVLYMIQVNISGVTDLTSWETWLSNNNTTIVYPLATATEEIITLTGDISDIGTATVLSDGTLTVKYDKAEMAIRKYSAKPDWSVIGYSDTPSEILSAFDYAKNLQRTWSFQKQTDNKDIRIFPDVDLTGYRDYSYMFANCTYLMSLPDLVIGEETPTGDIACNNFLYKTGVENLKLSTKTSSQKVYLNDGFCDNTNLKTVELNMKASSCQYMLGENRKLTRVTGTFDTSEVENFNYVFYNCLSLTTVPEWNTSSGKYFSRALRSCLALEYAPIWNLTSALDLSQMFWDSYNLKNIPFYNIPSATNLSNMFANTGNSLTENSRNNILLMCMSASAYTGTKTLSELGFTSSVYSAASWQSLTDYNNFVSAGWSIGYS